MMGTIMNLLRSISNQLRRFVQVGGRRRALLVEALSWLLLARLSLIIIPFRHVGRYLGTFVRASDRRVVEGQSDRSWTETQLAAEIGWAVTRAARYAPFRAVCLPQAMAARFMLKRRGVESVLHLGVRKGIDKPFEAHAWLDAAGVQVTGYPESIAFTEIARVV